MLTETLTYKDFNGKEQTGTFYFNLTRTELVEMEVDVDGGFTAYLESIIAANSKKEIIGVFKQILLKSFGQKSVDGLTFEKSEEISHKFSQTAAYDALFNKMFNDIDYASTFIAGIMPKEMLEEVQKLKQQDKPDASARPRPRSVVEAEAREQLPPPPPPAA